MTSQIEYEYSDGQNPRRSTNRVSNGTGKPYKIIMENVTEEKKPLNVQPTNSESPPRGYTFVPYGASVIINYCQEQSRRHGYVVYAVTDKRGAIQEQISRRGYHFKADLVHTARKVYGDDEFRSTSMASDNMVHRAQIGRRLENHARRLRKQKGIDKAQMQQEQVQATIQELFPKIPEDEAKAITKRAFEEGTDRVGNARDLTLERRVQLAVGAHARHVHTHYDQALKIMEWSKARETVEKDVLKKLIEWRGEGDPVDGAPELEEFFREVIVIDSDDENDAIERLNNQTNRDRSPLGPQTTLATRRHAMDRYDAQRGNHYLVDLTSESPRLNRQEHLIARSYDCLQSPGDGKSALLNDNIGRNLSNSAVGSNNKVLEQISSTQSPLCMLTRFQNRPIHISSRKPEEPAIQLALKRKAEYDIDKRDSQGYASFRGPFLASTQSRGSQRDDFRSTQQIQSLNVKRRRTASPHRPVDDRRELRRVDSEDMEITDLRPSAPQSSHGKIRGANEEAIEVIDLRSSVPREIREYDRGGLPLINSDGAPLRSNEIRRGRESPNCRPQNQYEHATRQPRRYYIDEDTHLPVVMSEEYEEIQRPDRKPQFPGASLPYQGYASMTHRSNDWIDRADHQWLNHAERSR